MFLLCLFKIQVICMDDYSFLDFETESLLMVVTSTFGNGDCPGNGQVWAQLCTKLLVTYVPVVLWTLDNSKCW